MIERDEEVDLDLEAGAKHLLPVEEGAKKRPKSKARIKKNKEDAEPRVVVKNQSQLPLSLLDGTPEDKALFEAKMSVQKNQVAGAKEYKTSIRFKVGEVLTHKSFGTGFVVAESGQNKIEVLFAKGRKLLISGM